MYINIILSYDFVNRQVFSHIISERERDCFSVGYPFIMSAGENRLRLSYSTASIIFFFSTNQDYIIRTFALIFYLIYNSSIKLRRIFIMTIFEQMGGTYRQVGDYYLPKYCHDKYPP